MASAAAPREAAQPKRHCHQPRVLFQRSFLFLFVFRPPPALFTSLIDALFTGFFPVSRCLIGCLSVLFPTRTVSSRANNKHGEAVLYCCYSREGELGWGRGRSPTRSVGARATAERSEAVRGAEGAEKPLFPSIKVKRISLPSFCHKDRNF